MLTLYEDYVAEAIEAGAVGYLLKDVKRGELSQAIRVAYHGQSPLNPSVARRLVSEFDNWGKDKTKSEASLTPRQRDILSLIGTGATNRQIASQLFLSETTVKREMHNLFDRLGVNSRSGAVSEAYRRKLI